MARSSNQINVGRLVNPMDGVTDSLSRLSATYGNMADRDNKKALEENKRLERAAAESKSDKRYNTTQGIAAEERAYRDESRAAGKVTNDWLQNLDPTNMKFVEANYDKNGKAVFDNARKSMATEKDAYKKYLASGDVKDLATASKLFQKGLGKGADASVVSRDVLQRSNNLGAVYAELSSITDPNKREALTEKYMDSLFKPRELALQEEISSGDSLIKKQKLAAIMGRLPEASRKHGDYARISAAVDKSLYGHTEQSLLAGEAKEVAAYNAAKKHQFDSATSKRVKGAKRKENFKSMLKTLDEDWGWFDNDDKKDAINFMLSDNIDPEVINTTLQLAKEKNWFGTSLPSVGSDAMMRLMTEAKERQKKTNLANGMTYDAEGNLIGGPSKVPAYTTRVARGLPEIQRSLMAKNSRGQRTILNVAQAWKDKYLGASTQPAEDDAPENLRSAAAATVEESATEISKKVLNPNISVPSSATDILAGIEAGDHTRTVSDPSYEVQRFNNGEVQHKDLSRAAKIELSEIEDAKLKSRITPDFIKNFTSPANYVAPALAEVSEELQDHYDGKISFNDLSKEAKIERSEADFAKSKHNTKQGLADILTGKVFSGVRLPMKAPVYNVEENRPKWSRGNSQTAGSRRLLSVVEAEKKKDNSPSRKSELTKEDRLDIEKQQERIKNIAGRPETSDTDYVDRKNRKGGTLELGGMQPIPGGSEKGFTDFKRDLEEATDPKERQAIEANYLNGAYEPAGSRLPPQVSTKDKRLIELLKRKVSA